MRGKKKKKILDSQSKKVGKLAVNNPECYLYYDTLLQQLSRILLSQSEQSSVTMEQH
jgi:hypothetical protein